MSQNEAKKVAGLMGVAMRQITHGPEMSTSHVSLIQEGELEQIQKWSVDTVATAEFGEVWTASAGATRCWLVNQSNPDQLMAPGLIGEIMVECERSATGHFTEFGEVVVDVPMPPWRAAVGPYAPGTKFFKTDHLATYKYDGLLKLLGEKNAQIYSQGKRIDVTMLEDELKQRIPDVKLLAVNLVTLESRSGVGGPQTVAMFCLDPSQEDIYDERTIKAVRTVQGHLENLLPASLVKPIVFPLPELPGLRVGVLDRKRIKLIASGLTARQFRDVELAHRHDALPMDKHFLEEQSPQQSRSWLRYMLYPDLAWQHSSVATRIKGSLSMEALNASIHAVEVHHDILRTTFSSHHGVNLRRIATATENHLTVNELDTDGDVMGRVLEGQAAPFDLEMESGWRVAVYRLEEDDYILSITLHDIVGDMMSIHSLQRQLSDAYSAAVQGGQNLLDGKELPSSNRADFTGQQTQLGLLDQKGDSLDYWMSYFENAQPAEFLCDRPRPARSSGKAEAQDIQIDGHLHLALQDFSAERGIEPVYVLLAALRATHYRMTGSNDSTIGVVRPHRKGQRGQGLVHTQQNLQHIRTRIESETFEQLVQQIKTAGETAAQLGDVPIEQIVAKSQTKHDLSRDPLVRVLLALHHEEDLSTLLLDDLDTKPLDLPIASQFDLEMHFSETPQGIEGLAIYSTDLYDPVTIRRIISVFLSVLERALEHSSTSILAMPLLTDAGYADLEDMDLLDVEETDFPRNSSIIDLFRQQAKAHPTKDAVKDATSSLTYAELDELSTCGANWLKKRDLAPETLVGVFASRSCQTIVAFLAILKAGLAYLPLDIKTPTSRLETILSSIEGGKLVLVGNDIQAPSLPEIGAEFVAISSILEPQVPHRKDNYTAKISGPSATSLAYVMFTSGSTGKPKGVMIEHRAVVRLVTDGNMAQLVATAQSIAHMTNVAFDFSTWEIYVALLNGKTLVCIDATTVLDTRAVAEVFARTGVEVANMAPALFKQYARESPDIIRTLKTLVLGGDRVDIQDVLAAREIMQGQLVNGYGPTENTTFSSYYCLADNESYTNGVPIGRPVSNSGAYVMDSHLRLVPIGVIGELVVTGEGLARGYTDSELNADRFVTVSIGGRSARAYRTGDYVRHRPTDGQMEFFGRIDGQVKIKGHRIEIGEIEVALGGHSSVTDAVVIVQQAQQPSEGRDQQLLAYVTTSSEFSEDEKHRIQEELHHRAEALLPPYMVPQAITILETMPVNANGKVDRKAISQISPKIQTSNSKKQQPMSQMERNLQKIWARVLNIDLDTIGIKDDFFRLGGDSITAMQVSSAARATQIEISTGDIFRKKTISDLAKISASASHQASLDISIKNVDGQAFPLSPVQMMYMQLEVEPNRCFDQPFFVRMRTMVPLESIVAALNTIVANHPMLRARFNRTQHGGWEQRTTSDVASSFSITEVTSPQYDGLEAIEAIKTCRSLIDIEKGPLVSAVVSNTHETQAIFLSVHHLVIDLVSWRILLQDLEEILVSGECSMSPTLSFQSWSSMQAQYVAKELQLQEVSDCELEPLLSYWGVEPSTNFLERTTTKQFLLDEQTTAAILGRSNEAFGTQPVELMIAALVHSFNATFADRRAPAIFSEAHGREPWDERLDLSRTIGWFTTLFPTRTRFSEDVGLLDVVRQTKDFLRGLSSNGWSFFTSRFSTESDAKVNSAMLPVEVLFNFAGAYQQLERGDSFFENLALPANCDPPSALGLRRLALFDVFAQTDHRRLSMTFVYPAAIERQDRIAVWIDSFYDSLKQLSVLLEERVPEWTLADFPMAFESYTEMGDFSSRLLPQMGVSSPQEVEDIFPCSPMQEGILLAQAKDPRNYRSIFGIEIQASKGEPDVTIARIQEAWRAVVRRHSLLRAIITNDLPGTSRAMMIILRDPAPGISFFQGKQGSGAYDGPVSYQKQGIQHHLSVFQVGEREAFLRLEMNHVIVDGYSSDILLRDFRLAYSNKLNLDGPSYSGFVKYVESQSEEQDREFWMKRLESAEPSFFPASQKNVSPKTFTLSVPEMDPQAISAFCMEWGVTTASIIQTAWALVLRTFSGSETPCFGTLTSGRDVPVRAVDDMFGPLICMMPCRVLLDSSRTVVEALREVQAEYVENLQHQTYPLMEIQRALGVGSAGLFNSIISFRRSGGEHDEAGEAQDIRYKDAQDQTEVRNNQTRPDIGN